MTKVSLITLFFTRHLLRAKLQYNCIRSRCVSSRIWKPRQQGLLAG